MSEVTEVSVIDHGTSWNNYFDTDAFIGAIRGQGVEFCHWRSMRCPIGLIDESTDRVVHLNHGNCSNGFLYSRAGSVKAILTGNAMDSKLGDIGMLDGSNVHVTIDTTYLDSGDEVYVSPFDRFYLADEAIVVSNWQLVTHTPAQDDRLNFAAVCVQDLVDSRGIAYKQDKDFTVTKEGRIHWISAGPGMQDNTNKGVIYSIRYTYRPYWLVSHLAHEIRVVQGINGISGQITKRMPQAAYLQREYIHRDQSNNPDLPESSRHVLAPEPKRYPDAKVTADYEEVRKLLR